MLSRAQANTLKEVAPLLINSINEGALFLEFDMGKIVWRLASNDFDVPELRIGTKISGLTIFTGPYTAMQEKRVADENTPRAAYGIRLVTKNYSDYRP